jgi:hypothetical protein
MLELTWGADNAVSKALLSACSKEIQPTEQDIVAKEMAHGGRPIAYLTRTFTGGGATGDTVYSVYLSSQSEGQLGEAVLEALHSCDMKFEWKGQDVLVVNYDGAACDVVKFKNYWYDPLEDKSNQ